MNAFLRDSGLGMVVCFTLATMLVMLPGCPQPPYDYEPDPGNCATLPAGPEWPQGSTICNGSAGYDCVRSGGLSGKCTLFQGTFRGHYGSICDCYPFAQVTD